MSHFLLNVPLLWLTRINTITNGGWGFPSLQDDVSLSLRNNSVRNTVPDLMLQFAYLEFFPPTPEEELLEGAKTNPNVSLKARKQSLTYR